MLESASSAQPKAGRAAPEAIVQLIVFQLGDEEYGIRIEQVKEVTVTPEVTRMPKTPAFIKGIANLRGDIIAIVDLEERFQLRRAGREELPDSSFTIAVEAPGFTIGLLVREVPRPLTLPLSLIEPAPEFLQDSGQRDKYLEGIAKLPEGGVIIVLDMLKLLTPTEILRLPGRGAPSAAPARTTA